jgi:uncharacterized protein with HEPN domain
MSRDPRRALDRARDILDAIANIHNDLGTLSKDAFLKDGKTQRAVIEGFIVVGEASNRMCDLRSDLEAVDLDLWSHLRDAYDMRNVLTHEYFRVDAGIVWETVQHELPVLEKMLQKFVLKESV